MWPQSRGLFNNLLILLHFKIIFNNLLFCQIGKCIIFYEYSPFVFILHNVCVFFVSIKFVCLNCNIYEQTPHASEAICGPKAEVY